jgi:predicted kinase
MQIYGAGATMRTFERLARCARTALRAGYPVIVDAAFLRSAERDVFRALARELRVPFTILHCTAGEARLRERVAARSTAGNDASEADLNVLDRQLEYCEPLSPEERAFAIEVSTDEPTDAAALYERILRKPVAPRQSRSGRAAEQSQSTSRRSP